MAQLHKELTSVNCADFIWKDTVVVVRDVPMLTAGRIDWNGFAQHVPRTTRLIVTRSGNTF